MIQRIQSIWLLLAAITILCLLVVPVMSASSNNVQFVLNAMGINGTNAVNAVNYPLLISVILAGLISLVNIFNFRNRTLQKRVASLNILLILGLSFWLSQLGKQLPGGLENSSMGAGLFLPLLAVIFTLLAIRGIKNDEKLIRSADRLR
jgi:hypothetical protein